MENQESINAEELLEKIFYYMNKLVDEKEFSSVILLLTDMGRTLVNSDRASFWYWDVRNKQYWTIAASDSERITVPEGTGIVGASIQNKEIILLNEPYKDERFNPEVDRKTGYITKSILCMPVTDDKGKVIGAYQAINKLNIQGSAGTFNEKDVNRLMLAAVYCGKTLESHLLYSEARTDQLTGLKNRRGFYEYYSDSIQSTLEKESVSLVMCDIDFFKKVNDTHGHNAGDAVLVHIAELLQGCLTEEGSAVRWGGEEFILILKGKSLEEAAVLAEQIRRCVEESTCEYREKQLKVTMSFGVKKIDGKNTLDENIKCVDEKLYEAKATGRNRVVK